MSNFFTSKSVSVFPSSYRKDYTKGKYTSEENFVNIINSIVDKDCYVLSTESSLTNEPLKVVLHGYYFEIGGFSLVDNQDFYVAIKVEQGANALVNFDNDASTETQLDLNDDFKGLAYSKSEFSGLENSDDYKYYTLKVAENGSLVNKVRLSSDSVYYGANGESVSSALNRKQENLSAGLGIDPDKLEQNEVALTEGYDRSLKSMSEAVGSNSQPVFINSDGEVTPLDGSSGLTQQTVTGSNPYTFVRAALITDGVLKNDGVQLFAGTIDPIKTVGHNGDFWFKYESSN